MAYPHKDVTCPRCGSACIYYRDVCIQIDYDYLAYDEGGRIEWTQTTSHTEYESDDVTSGMRGSIVCDGRGCGAEWPSIEALEEAIRQKAEHDRRPPFGELLITHV